MKRILSLVAAAVLLASCGSLNTTRLLQGAAYASQALMLPESDVIAYVQQYITQLDAQSPVLPETNAYTKRLRYLTQRLTQVGEIPLNYKVYQNNEINAFACADGSVRVYTDAAAGARSAAPCRASAKATGTRRRINTKTCPR